MYYLAYLLYSCLFLLVQLLLVTPRTISIILVVIGDNPGFGYRVSGPMFDVAFHRTKQQYPLLFSSINITNKILYKFTPDFSCGATSDLMYSFSGSLLNEIDQTQSFPILIAPGCSPEMISLGDVARELDVALIASTAADPKLDNRQRYPTFSSLTPAGIGGTTFAILQFLRQSSWRTVTLLCDSLSKSLSASSYYGALCRALTDQMTAKFGEFQLLFESFDSADPASSGYQKILLRAKRQSRVIIIPTNPDVFHAFLIQAYGLNMTDGDYVFIYPEALMVPGTRRLVDQTTFAGRNKADEIILQQSFPCVIMFRLPLPDWTMLQSFTQAVGQRAKEYYNYTFSPDQYTNEITLGISDTVGVLVQILNETGSNMAAMTGKMLSQRIAGRDFDVGYRKVTMLPNGDRYRDTSIHRFDSITKEFETTWWHSLITNSITVRAPSLANSWFGSPHLPPDKPLCGFQDELCSTNNQNETIIIAVVAAISSSVMIFCLGFYICRYRHLNDLWWLLSDGIGRKRSITRRPSGRASFVRIL